jgi:hypothetical protein
MLKTFPGRPTNIIHLGLPFIQKWRILLGGAMKNKVEEIVEAVMVYAREIKALVTVPSDVGFI